MAKRQDIRYLRADSKQPVSDEDIYTMTMLYQYQRLPVYKIARRYSLTVSQVRDLLGRRSSGSCCG